MAGNRSEYGGKIRSHKRHARNDSDCNEGREKSVFNCGHSPLDSTPTWVAPLLIMSANPVASPSIMSRILLSLLRQQYFPLAPALR